jgi:hypothetical protein
MSGFNFGDDDVDEEELIAAVKAAEEKHVKKQRTQSPPTTTTAATSSTTAALSASEKSQPPQPQQTHQRFLFGSGQIIWENELDGQENDGSCVSIHHLVDRTKLRRGLFSTFGYELQFMQEVLGKCTAPVLIVKHCDTPSEREIGLAQHFAFGSLQVCEVLTAVLL